MYMYFYTFSKDPNNILKHQKKIEDLLGEVGNFVIQQESVKLSLIPTKLLKSKDFEDEPELSYITGSYYRVNEYEGSSDEESTTDESSKTSQKAYKLDDYCMVTPHFTHQLITQPYEIRS